MELENNLIHFKADKKKNKKSKFDKHEFTIENDPFVDIQNIIPQVNAPVEMTKVIVILPMTCQWNTCNLCFSDIYEYRKHLKFHLEELRDKNINNTDLSWTLCPWEFCESSDALGYEHLARHIYYHAFHTHIKQIGNRYIIEHNLQQCKMDILCRNVIPALDEKLICKWDHCGAVFLDVFDYYEHVKQHGSEKIPAYNTKTGYKCLWSKCTSHLKYRSRLKEHLKTHTSMKEAACPCCGNLFSTLARFNDHIQRQFPSTDKIFKCGQCSKVYSSISTLKSHMRHHVNRFQCEICNMSLTSYSNLRTHMTFRHSNTRPFKCSLCEFRGKTKWVVQKHQLTHSETFINCEVENCNFRCRERTNLELHMSRLHKKRDEKPYRCHLCEKSYTAGKFLGRHLEKIHKFGHFTGLRRFKYSICEDGYYRLDNNRVDAVTLAVPKASEFQEKLQRGTAQQDGDQEEEEDEEEEEMQYVLQY